MRHNFFRGSGWLMVSLLALLPSLGVAEVGPAVTGFTGRANDALAVFWSPAALTRLDKPELVAQGMLVYSEAKFEVDSATFDGGSADNDNRLLAIPGIYYAHPLGERWRLGVSLNVPSGIGNNYGRSWSGRYLAEDSELAFVATSAVAAYKISDSFSLAAGGFLVYTSAETKARINNIDPDTGDGRIDVDEDGSAVGLMLGAMYEFSDATRVAATYRSAVEPKLSGTPTFRNLDPLLRDVLAAADLLGTEVDVKFKVPAQLQAGFYTEFSDRWSMTGDAMWVNMSDFGISRLSVEQDSLTVDVKDFRDILVGSAGFKYQYRPDRAISAGAMYVSSAISDARRTIALPLDRVLGVGVGLTRPCRDFVCHINLNYFDLGDGDLSEGGGPLTGAIEGSFRKHWAMMLDFQVKMQF